jgi:hypothetical protein
LGRGGEGREWKKEGDIGPPQPKKASYTPANRPILILKRAILWMAVDAYIQAQEYRS